MEITEADKVWLSFLDGILFADFVKDYEVIFFRILKGTQMSLV